MDKRNNSSQEQIHDLLFRTEIGWKEIIFDLINTSQLDPWDIDIGILADKFMERVEELEEMDFFISSQVLLAASLLLRLKAEILLSKYMRGVDEILFGSEDSEKKRSTLERIDLEEDIPELIPKSPMPRYKRVTLAELIESLNKAIITENRRIKKTIVNQNALRETGISLPKKQFNISHKIKHLKSKIVSHFDANQSHRKVSYTKLVGDSKEERALSFFPLLQLEMNGDVWLHQEAVFEEIDIWLKEVYLKYNPDPFSDLKIDMSELTPEEVSRLDEVEKIGDLLEEE